MFDNTKGLVLRVPYQHDKKTTTEEENMFIDQYSGKGLEFSLLVNVVVRHTDRIVMLSLGFIAPLDSVTDTFVILKIETGTNGN